MEVFMYERMLNKQETPTMEEMIKFCGENSERFLMLDEERLPKRARLRKVES